MFYLFIPYTLILFESVLGPERNKNLKKMIEHGPTSSSLSHHRAIMVFTVLHFAFLSVFSFYSRTWTLPSHYHIYYAWCFSEWAHDCLILCLRFFFFFLNIIYMMKQWHWPARCIIFISVPMWNYIFKYSEWIKNAGKEMAVQSLVLVFSFSPYRDVHIIDQQRAALTQKLHIYINESRENDCEHFRFLSHHRLSPSAWETCFFFCFIWPTRPSIVL